MNQLPRTAPYTLLQARSVRSEEALNVGVVLYAPGGSLVAIHGDRARLRALHPDFGALQLAGRAEALQEFLQSYEQRLNPEQQHMALRWFAKPFQPLGEHPALTVLHDDPKQTLTELMQRLVVPPARTLRPANAPGAAKRPTKLAHELRAWLRLAKVFSSNAGDLQKGKVVANYPIDPGADLYADFAVLNGALNAIETLDLRGVEKLTPTLRGEAAIKGVTLDEARERITGRRVVVLSASDYAVARPAIQLISRYADDVWDMNAPGEKQKLASFFATALHRDELPGLELAS